MPVRSMLAFVLVLIGCVTAPQYRDPLGALVPTPVRTSGPFKDSTLRVVLSDNTQQTATYIADHARIGSAMGAWGAMSLDSGTLTERIRSVLASRFKDVLFVRTQSEPVDKKTDVTMIFDAKALLAMVNFASNSLELSGVFLDEQQQIVEVVKGTGEARNFFKSGFGEALDAAFVQFSSNLDNAPKLTAFLSSRRADTTPMARRPVTPRADLDLRAKARGLGGASWALVVGIDAYRQADPLNYAVADARSVAGALPGLGFQEVRLLLNDDATKANIERAIYGDLRARMGPKDRLFVFFAGHGITVKLPRGGEEGYLVPVDGDPRQPELTAIPMDEIRKMGRRVAAKHIFFAIDSCFSGFAITRDIAVEPVTDPEIEAALDEPVVQVLTAGRKGQKAIEEGGHGLFTRRLLDGLRGLADREGRGFVTVTQLAAWLAPRVARDSGGRQHPQYSALDGEGDFLFLLPPAQAPAQRSD